MVKVILLNMESEKTMNDTDMVIMDTIEAREKVTNLEREIQTIKESFRCTSV